MPGRQNPIPPTNRTFRAPPQIDLEADLDFSNYSNYMLKPPSRPPN